MEQLAYVVEIDEPGCTACGSRATYCIVGPDGIALGTSYESQDAADELCELLNNAYELGLQSKVPS